MWKSLWGFRSVKIYLKQTFVASSWPSAWQHFRQFCSNEGSDVRLKGFSSSHELQMRFTENPKSLHSSGVNSARVIWIKVKKMERKGEIYIFQSISNSSPNRLMSVLGPSLFSVLFDRGWKKISNHCKPLNTVSQSGKTVSLLLSKKSGANDGQILIKKQPTWEMSWHSLLKRDHPVEQWKQFVNYIPSEIKVFRFGLTSTKNWKICFKHRSISRFRRKSVVNPCNGSAVIVNPWNSASQSGKSMNYLVQHETWRSFPKSLIVFWQQEGKQFLVSYANLSFCYHSFC